MKFTLTMLLLVGSHNYVMSQKPNIKQAHELLVEGYLEEALDMFNELEKNNENNAEFYFLRGSCLSELGENDRAITDLNISISLDNKNANAYYQCGFAYFTIGDSPAALENFNQAIQISPDYGEAYLNRGTVQYDLGNTEEACQDWKSALNTGLTLAQALLNQLCKD
ncbi:MAG: tetratricopeptide repeat protein [Reichenbachiella sp.]|uniref:tetratricopeptide repeat protein n=1 Tax=Reichenbachiella sp. TaxID=2184521 RepID=UPI003263BE84